MGTGVVGTFAIRWSQISVDGLGDVEEEDLREGASWRWTGTAMRIDGPDGVMRLGGNHENLALHERAAAKARRICGRVARMSDRDGAQIEEDRLLDKCIILTDGRQVFVASRIASERAGALAVFHGALPLPDRDLWIVKVATNARAEALALRRHDTGTICFASGTEIQTPSETRPVERLRPGDMVQTRDGGAQPILWIGMRNFSGAQLHLAPHLRPIRIAAGALQQSQPALDLLVSPLHRLLISGRSARALFSEPEVLVRARDLLGVPGVSVDFDCPAICYVHLMLGHHHLLTASGLPCESFHPDEADFSAMEEGERQSLEQQIPDVLTDPTVFGPPARRRLAAGEAHILASGMA